MNKTRIIIGTSAAGIGAALALRRLSATDSIVCISAEQDVPYNKCFLADYAHGQKGREEIQILTREIAQQKNIELLLGTRVLKIDRNAKAVLLDTHATLSYDTLLIATGASPHVPPIEGMSEQGVFTFHSLADVDAILAYVNHNNVTKAVVIGAGLSGLESADALKSHNVRVTVIECAPRVLCQQVDPASSEFIQEKMHAAGITFLPNTRVQKIISESDRAIGVLTEKDEQLDADLVVCAAGVRPNISLAQEIGLEITRGGIRVDQSMRTSDEHIFAAGDCVVVPNALTGELVNSSMWPDAMQQGMIAAHSMTGQAKSYSGTLPILSSAFFGVKFAACGPMANTLTSDSHLLAREVREGLGLSQILLSSDDLVRGFCLVGDTRDLSLLRRLILTKKPLSRQDLSGGGASPT
jgi:NAD(P)H-nitrite reductase large subunit